MKKILLLLILFCSIYNAEAQYTVSGTLKDTAISSPVKNAAVVLYRKIDSILSCFTRSDQNGNFTLKTKDSGAFFLLIAHPKYADIKDEVYVGPSAATVNKGEFDLTARSIMLKEAIVRAKQGSMKVKGDTLMYMADSFQLAEGANVEDLLQQLPGIEVDKEGNIKAQGQSVKKVLVDGEEFFGDDPTVATKNLDAKIVDKVEVFDQKSDQASFTGFDDGEKSKTINLKLKKGMNKGAFGKVEAAGDGSERWKNRAMINSFKDKRKLSAFGIYGSVYDMDLSWKESQDFSQNEFEMNEEDGFFISYRYDDGEDEGSDNEGRPKAGQASLSYSNKFNDNKLSVNATGSYKQKNIVRNNSSKITNNYESTSIFNQNLEDINASKTVLSGSTKLEWKLDTMHTIKLSLSASSSETEKNTLSNSVNLRNLKDTSSSSAGTKSANANNDKINATFSYLQKLKKKGRTFSFTQTLKNENKVGSNNIYANNYLLSFFQLQDQRISSENKLFNASSKVVYTEPLKKEKVLMELNYSYTLNNNSQQLYTRIKNGASDYNYVVDSLSNNFVSDFNTHRGGVKFRFQQKKYTMSIGTDVAKTIFDQQDLIKNKLYNYARINIIPTANINYKFSQYSAINFNYAGSTRQPSLAQLQPISNITDPLNVYIGNPNLKQAFNENFTINFWNYKMINERSYWIGAWIANTFNAISTVNTFDTITGRNIYTYENLQGNVMGNYWSGWQRKFAKNWQVGVNLNGNFSNTPYMINQVRRLNKYFTAGLNPYVNYSISAKLNAGISFEVSPHWNNQNGSKSQYWTLSPSSNIKYTPNKRWKFDTDIAYVFQNATPPFTQNFNQTIWNFGSSYKFLKKTDLSATFNIHDILGQNTGYQRYFSSNSTTEINNFALRRYALIGLLWNFNTQKPKEETKSNDIEIDF